MNETTGRKTYRLRLDQMIADIRSKIQDGTYDKDSYLPSESALAKQFHLSNNTVRKGLEVLVQEQLIVKVNKVGSKVIGTPVYERTVLSVAGYPMNNRDLDFSKLIADFQEKHPSITVKWNKGLSSETFMPGRYTEHIAAYIENGTVDVFLLDHLNFRELVESGHAPLLEPIVPNPELYPFLYPAFLYEGQTYVQPIVFSPVVLCYNRDHFRQARIAEPDSSWTWDDLIRNATALTIPNEQHGFYFFQTSENRWPLLLLQSDIVFSSENRGEQKKSRDDQETQLLHGIRLYGEIVRNRDFFPSYMSETAQDVNRLFLEEKVSMTLATYTSLNDLKHSKLDYDISVVPYMHTPITLLTVMGVLVSKNSQNKEAAQLFADYLVSREAQQSIRCRTLSLPSMKEIAEMPVQDELNRPRHYSLFREIIHSYRIHADMHVPVRSYATLLHVLKLYWSGMINEQLLRERLKEMEWIH